MTQLKSTLTILMAAASKVKQLVSKQPPSEMGSIMDSFAWQASVHFTLSKPSNKELLHSCALTTLSGSLPYGFCYTGSLENGLTLGPLMERECVHLLQLMKQRCFTVVTGQVSA